MILKQVNKALLLLLLGIVIVINNGGTIYLPKKWCLYLTNLFTSVIFLSLGSYNALFYHKTTR